MSPSPPARDGNDPQELEQPSLDVEIEALISDHQDLHKIEARLHCIECTTCAGHQAVDDETADEALAVYDQQIGPELRTQDLRRVVAGCCPPRWTRGPVRPGSPSAAPRRMPWEGAWNTRLTCWTPRAGTGR